MVVKLNARLSEAIIGPAYQNNEHVQWTRVDLDESRRLKGTARLVHFALSHMVEQGQDHDIPIDTLMRALCYDAPGTVPSGNVLRSRRADIKGWLRELREALRPAWEMAPILPCASRAKRPESLARSWRIARRNADGTLPREETKKPWPRQIGLEELQGTPPRGAGDAPEPPCPGPLFASAASPPRGAGVSSLGDAITRVTRLA